MRYMDKPVTYSGQGVDRVVGEDASSVKICVSFIVVLGSAELAFL
jgi:hypothetical protein